jgi:predicted RNase H-like HicB family nuclease
MKSAEYLKRPYARLVLPDTDGSFAAEIFEFPGCVAVGATPAEALANLDEVAVDWIDAAIEQGQEIPEPFDSASYSGKLVLRMAKSLHKRAAQTAEHEGISLNQFINNCVAEQVGIRARPIIASTPAQAVTNFNFQAIGIGAPVLLMAPASPSPMQSVTSTGQQLVGFSIPNQREARRA